MMSVTMQWKIEGHVALVKPDINLAEGTDNFLTLTKSNNLFSVLLKGQAFETI